MKIFKTYSIISVLLFTVGSNAFGDDIKVTQLESRPAIQFKAPEVQIHEYANGIRLYYLQNKELPIFQLNALLRVGTIHQPEDKLGILQLMMEGLKTGGTISKTGDEVDASLEQYAAQLTQSTQQEMSLLGIKSLYKYSNLSLDILFDILMHPRFESEKIEIARTKMMESIQLRNEDPMNIASREFKQMLYGPNSEWARLYNEDTLKKVSIQEIKEFYHQYVNPKNIWLAAAGPDSFEKVIANVGQHILKWNIAASTLPNVKKVQKQWDSSLNIIDQQINQSSIIVGHFGETRFNEDKYALILANFVLGGSTFGSRLGNRIRTSLGLAYSIRSDFSFKTDYGAFMIMTSTKTESTKKLIIEIQNILKDVMTQHPVTETELDFAKKTILNQLIFEYAEPFNIVEAKRYYDFYGYPDHYLEIYQEKLAKVTLNEVREVMKKYFYPQKLITLVVGNRDQLDDLKEIGDFRSIPLDNF